MYVRSFTWRIINEKKEKQRKQTRKFGNDDIRTIHVTVRPIDYSWQTFILRTAVSSTTLLDFA